MPGCNIFPPPWKLPERLETKGIASRAGESACIFGSPATSFTGHCQMAFIIVAGICLCLYFLFLCFMVFQVFRNINGKQSSLPAMSKVRRLHYEVSKFLRSFRSWLVLAISCLMCKHTHTHTHTPGDWKHFLQIHVERCTCNIGSLGKIRG